MKKLVLYVAAGVLSGVWMSAQQLPIRRVLLYKNGMAYLVRSGSIEQPLRLTFHPHDMKDVLKTFSAWNPTTGQLYPVGYTSDIPTAQILRRFPFNLEGGTGLAQFLQQIQGARVRLTAGSSQVVGKLLSVSQEQHAVDQQTLLVDHRLSVVQLDSKVETLWLSELNSMELEDPELRDQLQRYLDVVAQGNQDTTREITVYPLPAKGPIQIAYIQQFPVWKTSYRLQLAGKDSSIQGWSQIDNPTGEAWKEVDLTLISGMPVSFIMDLYKPLHTSRTTVQVPGSKVATPRAYEAAVNVPTEAYAGQPSSSLKEDFRAQRMSKVRAEAPVDLTQPGSATFVQAQAEQIQDYFEYRFPFPVQIADRESALLPFMRKRIAVESVSIFNPDTDKHHPLTGAWLENTTDVPLEAGPITFFVEGRYAGEAVLEHLSRGERRLVSYGMDQDVEIFREQSSQPETTVFLTVSRGTVVFQKEQVQVARYQIRNKAKKTRVLLIEHPKRSGRVLKKLKPMEITENFFRFRVEMGPGRELEFPVPEIISSQTSLSIGELNRRQLEVHFSALRIPAELRQQLEGIVSVREEIASLQNQVRRVDQGIEAVFRDQKRIRENLRSLGRSQEEAELRQRYLGRLNEQEESIDELRRARSGLTQQISDRETLLAQRIEQMSFSLDLSG